MKFKKTILLLLIPLILMLSVVLISACGKDKENFQSDGTISPPNSSENNKQEDNTDPSTPQKKTYDMSNVVFEDLTIEYDGQSHSIYATNLPQGVTVTYDGNDKINAGTYTITAHFTGDSVNYNSIPDKTAALTINKATYDMSNVIFEDLTVEYDGQTHSIMATNLPTGVTATYTNNNQIEIGKYTVTAHFTGDGTNYNHIPDKTAVLTITTPIKNGITSANGFDIDNSKDIPLLHCEVSNSTEFIDLSNKITVTTNCTWKLYKDFIGTTELVLKAMSLEIGHNTAYIIVFDSANNFVRYEVDVYRLDMKSYTFTNVDNIYSNGTIEEKSYLNSPEEPERIGYTFTGWAIDGTSEIIEFPYVVIDNIIFVAQYEIINYIITYHLNGGKNAEGNLESYNIETTIELLAPSREYYEFDGWFSDEQLHTRITTIETNSYGDIELYAKWIPTDYQITYHLNGGTNDTHNPLSYNFETDIIFFAEPTKPGYDFIGWFSDENFKESITQIPTGSHGEFNLWAKWEIVTYTITYHLNGGTNNPLNPHEYDVETTFIFLNPSKESYIFSGWYCDEEYNTAVSKIEIGSYGDLNLYAQWGNGTEGLLFTLNGNTYAVSGYSGAETHIKIPSEWKGKAVTKIESLAFLDKTNITDIFIPDSITYIGDSAFRGCSGLINITIPFVGKEFAPTTGYNYPFGSIFGTVSYFGGIKTEQFYYTSSTTTKSVTYYIPSSLRSVTVTGGKLICWGAFYNCSMLTSFTMGENISQYDTYGFVFEGCTNLVEFYYNTKNCLNEYGGLLRGGNRNLKSVTIGEAVQRIPHEAFAHGGSITEVNWYATNCIEGSNLFSSSIEIVNFGENVKTIPEYAFSGCSKLTSIVITNSIESIGYYAFENCSNLKTVYWNAINCTSGGFLNTTSITSVIIGKQVKSMPNMAFRNCKNLVNVIFEENSQISSVCGFSGCSSITNITIPDSATSIGATAFSDCISLQNITIPDSVTSIGRSAFSGCTSLQSITIPDGVTSIEGYTFEYCTSLTNLVIPNNVKTIGNLAFKQCSSLTTIEIPDNVTLINLGVFKDCTNLTTVYWRATNCTSSEEASGNYSIFAGCTTLTTVVIGDNVQTIPNNAFYYPELKTVYYEGTAEQWNKISIGSANTELLNAMKYNYSKEEPNLNEDATDYDDNYWHYVDGVPTIWKKEN